MAATLRVSLSRESLVYNPGETIQGKVEILNQANTTHAGLSVRVQGNLHLVPGGRDQGKQEQVITLLSKTKQILAPGKILGDTEVDFSLQLIPEAGMELYETYHGLNVAVEYLVTAELTRTGLKKALKTVVDFILQKPSQVDSDELSAPESFEIEGIGGISESKIVGHLQSSVIDVRKPVEGELEIVKAPPIETIELQVVRKENITVPQMVTESTSEAQSCEIVNGNIERNLKVPIYCILQKFVVCASVETSRFILSFLLRFRIKYKEVGTGGSREHYFDLPVTFCKPSA